MEHPICHIRGLGVKGRERRFGYGRGETEGPGPGGQGHQRGARGVRVRGRAGGRGPPGTRARTLNPNNQQPPGAGPPRGSWRLAPGGQTPNRERTEGQGQDVPRAEPEAKSKKQKRATSNRVHQRPGEAPQPPDLKRASGRRSAFKSKSKLVQEVQEKHETPHCFGFSLPDRVAGRGRQSPPPPPTHLAPTTPPPHPTTHAHPTPKPPTAEPVTACFYLSSQLICYLG
jgi:hypothetical protein